MEEPTPPKRSWLQIIFISPDEPRLRAGWRLLGQFILLVISYFILGLLTRSLLNSQQDITFAGFLLLNMLILSLAVTLSVFIARRYLDRRTFASLGLSVRSQSVYDFTFGVALAGLIIGLMYAIEWAAGWIQIEALAWRLESWENVTASIVIMVILFGLVSWQEELITRGYWLQNFSDGLNLSMGVILSSALFVLIHLGNPNQSWQAYVGLFLSGLFLAFGYLRTHHLWLPIGLHLGWNLFEGTVFGFPVSGQYFYQLIRQTVSGPDIITGGAFGPEGGLILLPALLLGTAGVFWYTKDRNLNQAETPGDN